MQLNQQAALQTQEEWQKVYTKMTDELNQAVVRWTETGKGFGQSMAAIMNGITANFTKNILQMTEQFLVGLLLQKQGQKNQIMADAKTAAANTYAAVSAIPIVGPFLAPPAAAAAFGAVMAFESFNEGGVVNQGGGMHVPILAKQGERVLTPTQTENFHSLVNNSQSQRSNVTNHLHYNPTVNAYDRSGMRSTLQSHSDDILDIVRQGYQAGKLSPA